MQLTYILPLALTAVVNANIVKDPLPPMGATPVQPMADMPGMPGMPMPAAAPAPMADMPGMPMPAAAPAPMADMPGMAMPAATPAPMADMPGMAMPAAAPAAAPPGEWADDRPFTPGMPPQAQPGANASPAKSDNSMPGMAGMPGMPAAEASPAMSESMPGMAMPGAESSSSGSKAGPMASTKTLAQVIEENKSQLSTFNTLLAMEPDLLQMLMRKTDITILAPSNAAFTKFEANAGNKAQVANSMMLAGILEYHVLKGMHMAADIPNKMVFLPSLLGTPMNMSASGRSMGAAMKKRHEEKQPGMAGSMEGMPGMPMAGSAPEAAAAPKEAATNGTSSNGTMVMSNVRGGQVVGIVKNGNKVELMAGLKEIATVQTADLMYNGGVIHIIDNVMTVPRTVSQSALDSSLTAMVGALKTTNLVNTVDMMRDVTVFAPNNAAFMAIGGTAQTLNTQQLSTILQYHVVRGTVGYSTLLTMGMTNRTLNTLAGAQLKVTMVQNKVFVNSAQVVQEDILVNNGVMHVINEVMNPRNSTGVPNPAATVAPVAFEGAVPAAQVPFTSGINPTTTAPSAAMRTNAAPPHDNPIVGAMGAAALLGFVAVL